MIDFYHISAPQSNALERLPLAMGKELGVNQEQPRRRDGRMMLRAGRGTALCHGW